VRRQVEHVALSVKQGSQVSDLRRHTFSGKLRGAQVVYFRASKHGACDYVDDSRWVGGGRGVHACLGSAAALCDCAQQHMYCLLAASLQQLK
jgi:hypothetical protein